METPTPNPSRRDVLRNGLLLSLAGTGGFSMMRDENRLQVVAREIPMERWIHGKVRVAFLTDLHANFQDELDRSLAAINLAVKAKPDLILLGGDYVSGDWALPKAYVIEIANRLAQTGIPTAGVFGNHDIYSRPDQLKLLFGQAGIPILVNERMEVGGIPIIGLADALLDRPDYQHQALGDSNVLCLLHEPDAADRVPAGTSLVLSGHSHGGQIVLPGFRHTPVGAKRYIEGLYQSKGPRVYVSRGIGTTGPKLRIMCPPEVTIIDLIPA